MKFNYNPIKKGKENVVKTYQDLRDARKGNKQAIINNENLAIRKNLKKFNTTPSKIKGDIEGFQSKETKGYFDAKDADIKAGEKKMGIKWYHKI